MSLAKACTLGAAMVLLLAPQKSRAFQSSEANQIEFDHSSSELRPLMERFTADRGNLQRFYNLEDSPERRERFRKYYEAWLSRLSELNFDKLSQDGKIDYIVFRNGLDHDIRVLDLNAKDDADAKPYVPFAPTILELEMCRQEMQTLDPREAAEKLSKLTKEIEDDAERSRGEDKISDGGRHRPPEKNQCRPRSHDFNQSCGTRSAPGSPFTTATILHSHGGPRPIIEKLTPACRATSHFCASKSWGSSRRKPIRHRKRGRGPGIRFSASPEIRAAKRLRRSG